jgi:hypothetical protein
VSNRPTLTPREAAALDRLLVTEAGGQISVIDGTVQRYDGPLRGAIVSNGRVHGALVDLIAAGYPF